MIGYSVYLPKDKASLSLTKLDSLVFIKEGIAWLAVLSPLIWALVNRLWMLALIILCVMAFVKGSLSYLDVSPVMQSFVILLLNVIFAIEANRLRMWLLEKEGYYLEGFVTGKSESDCQRRFFQDWLPAKKAVTDPILDKTDRETTL